MNTASTRASANEALWPVAGHCADYPAGRMCQPDRHHDLGTPIDTASTAVPEEQLLDVGIAIFDPGIDDYEEGEQTYPGGAQGRGALSCPSCWPRPCRTAAPGVRCAWCRIPEQINDLVVRGKILHSDGEELQLHINATDSRGRVWLDKDYTGRPAAMPTRSPRRNPYDPFQAVYNTIANDLLQQQEKLHWPSATISAWSPSAFARSFSPEAFDGYLDREQQGQVRGGAPAGQGRSHAGTGGQHPRARPDVYRHAAGILQDLWHQMQDPTRNGASKAMKRRWRCRNCRPRAPAS